MLKIGNCENLRVLSKTGTVQVIKLGGYESNRNIFSFLGMAPMNDPKVLCYIAVEASVPGSYGSVVSAPYVGEVLEESLSYLGVKRDYDNQIEKNLRWMIDSPTYRVDNYIGISINDIKNKEFYNYVIYGEGNNVIYQVPSAGEKVKEGDSIMLYVG